MFNLQHEMFSGSTLCQAGSKKAMHSNIDLYKIQMYAAPEIKSPLLLLMLSLPLRLLPRPMGLLLRPMVCHVITGSAQE